jgi:colanic acid/amylovoran biosynthesis protein
MAILNIGRLNIFHLSNEVLKEYKTADIIVDIWGIIFAGSQGGDLTLLVTLLVSKLLKKPVIKYTADIGPFTTTKNRLFAKFYLRNIDLILARSEKTKKNLLELGITAPIYVCPDTAFLLEPARNNKNDILSKEKLKGKTLVGMTVSHVADRKERDKDKYASVMAGMVDYLAQKLDAFVVLIPNEIFPNRYDDLCVAKKIYRKINRKDKVILLMKEYPANELKGIIGKCDLFIGARYHSIVAATSMCIPTLAISWHHKYHEVMELMGQEEYVCEIESLSFSELREKIDSLWENKEKVKAKMASNIPFVKESILTGGKLVKIILERHRKMARIY